MTQPTGPRAPVTERPGDGAEPKGPAGRRPRLDLFTLAFAAAVVVFLLVRLGPSLVGARVFAGLDVFDLFAPWSHLPGAADPVETTTFVTDQIDVNFPAMHEIRQRLLGGDIALWTSMVAGGYALLGTINLGMISPTRFLYFVLPTWLAPGWSKLVEIGFAGAFTYLLVRRLGGSRAGAALAGFVYPLTGFMIGWTNWTQTAVAAVIPMLFWSVERFAQTRRLRDLVPVSVATALLVLGGFPAVAGQALYLAGGYALARVLVLSWRRWGRVAVVRDLAGLLAAVVLGIGLSAVQLLPFAVQTLGDVDLTYRSEGFYEQALPQYLLTTIFPGSFAGNDLVIPPGMSGASSPMDLNAYVGGVVVILAALGLLQVRRMTGTRSAHLYLLGIIALVVGLVWFQGPWSDWIGELPVFSGNPIGRFRSQLGLPAAVLAALGVDWIRRAPRERAGGGEALLGAVVALGITGVATVAGVVLLRGRIIGSSDDVGTDVVWTLAPMVLLSLLLLARARAVVGASPARRARLGTSVAAVAAVGVVLQAFPATAFYWPTGERSEFFASSAGIEYLQENLGRDRIATLGHPIRPNTTHYYGIRTLNGHVFAPLPMKDVFTAIDPASFIGPTYSIFSPNIRAVAASQGLNRFAVRYLVAQADADLPGQLGHPVPIPGLPDALDAAVTTGPVVSGGIYVDRVTPGPLRGVHVPLEVRAPSAVFVTLRDSAGAVLARNWRKVAPTTGLQEVPVALALGDGVDAPGPWSVSVVVDGPDVDGTFDAERDLRIRPVRDFARGGRSDDGLTVAFAGEGMIIWERAHHLPRIRWADEAVVIEDADERVAAVASRWADPGEVILEEDPGFPIGPAGTRADLEVLEDSGDTIRVRTSSDAPGLLVVSDSIQLDFEATVDGVPAGIVPADHAGGAVPVPEGEHVVEIRYASPEQRVGAAVTVLSAIGLVLLAILPGVVARRRSRGSQGEGSRPAADAVP